MIQVHVQKDFLLLFFINNSLKAFGKIFNSSGNHTTQKFPNQKYQKFCKLVGIFLFCWNPEFTGKIMIFGAVIIVQDQNFIIWKLEVLCFYHKLVVYKLVTLQHDSEADIVLISCYSWADIVSRGFRS